MKSMKRDTRLAQYTKPVRFSPFLRRQYADWFRKAFTWQLFATLTFSHDQTSWFANAALGRYLRRIEEETGAPLACLIAEEGDYSVRGENTGRLHFHLLIHCAKHLDRLHLTEVWKEDCFGGDRTVGPSALVSGYEREVSGTFYMMKEQRDPDWEWAEWRLEGASKRKPKRFATSSEARRMWKRQQQRAQLSVDLAT
ncbi:MAG: hypothetical protein ABI197_00770 [Granulicella sp.]